MKTIARKIGNRSNFNISLNFEDIFKLQWFKEVKECCSYWELKRGEIALEYGDQKKEFFKISLNNKFIILWSGFELWEDLEEIGFLKWPYYGIDWKDWYVLSISKSRFISYVISKLRNNQEFERINYPWDRFYNFINSFEFDYSYSNFSI
jgi:hypothetical protein